MKHFNSDLKNDLVPKSQQLHSKTQDNSLLNIDDTAQSRDNIDASLSYRMSDIDFKKDFESFSEEEIDEDQIININGTEVSDHEGTKTRGKIRSQKYGKKRHVLKRRIS